MTERKCSTEGGGSEQSERRKGETAERVSSSECTEDLAPRTHEDIKQAVRKGLLIVNTGDGKGKTTAALGIVFRALGRDFKIAMVQFIKGKWKPAELKTAELFKDKMVVYAMGDGFTWKTQNLEQDIASARKAWEKCKEILADAQYNIVIFDELNYVMKYKFLPVAEVIEGLKSKPPLTHVIITGRSAPQELIDMADMVTEMKCIKHPYQQGIKAQPGIEY